MRLILILLGVLVLMLQYRLWVSEDGYRSVWSLKEAVSLQRQENAELTERNARLEAEVLDLKEGMDAVEEIARSDLGMIGPDETLYQIAAPEEDSAAGDP